MRVFLTGASGWIGSATVDELLANGHEVVGMARSDASATALAAKGVTVHRGDLDDVASLRAGAENADAVIHFANKHDFSDFAGSSRAEGIAVETFLQTLEGSGRALVIASGVVGLAQGRPAVETDRSSSVGLDSPRGGAENRALDFADRGVRTVVVRFSPTVHGAGDHGFTAELVRVARERGAAGYIGDGANRWPAVHRSDAARLVRLGLESAPAGSVLHAVAEDGVPTSDIAEAIGRGLDLPVVSVDRNDVAAHFGWIGLFFGMDGSASSVLTREQLGWNPSGPTLLDDIAAGAYFAV